MSYQVIKDYFKRRLATFTFSESKQKINLINEAENYDNLFVIENPKVELSDGDTLATRFFPKRTFIIKIARKISESGIIFEYDSIQTRFENVIRDLHSVSNYRSDSIRSILFNSMSVTVESGYVLGEMTFIVEDSLEYV